MNTLYPDQVTRLIRYSDETVWPPLLETQQTALNDKVQLNLEFQNMPVVSNLDMSLDEETQFITKIQINKLLDDKIKTQIRLSLKDAPARISKVQTPLVSEPDKSSESKGGDKAFLSGQSSAMKIGNLDGHEGKN